jgi:putative oxidoreductase
MNAVANTYTANNERAGSTVRDTTDLLGRLMLATIFIVSGYGKIAGYDATAGYMAALGVPALLLPVVIALELGGGIALALGWKTRIVAFLLGGFTMLAALIFHSDLGDQIQQIMFLKNVAIAGAFLMLVANGPGALTLDRYLAK